MQFGAFDRIYIAQYSWLWAFHCCCFLSLNAQGCFKKLYETGIGVYTLLSLLIIMSETFLVERVSIKYACKRCAEYLINCACWIKSAFYDSITSTSFVRISDFMSFRSRCLL